MKNVYFLSDAHLGSVAVAHQRQQERRLVRFLDSVKHKASAIYLLGDMFDFWHEYKTVVPRGFTRFLGKLSELSDMGVEVHYFTGNHDLWTLDYLEKECGVILHHQPATLEIADKVFFLAHGDGLGDGNRSFKCLRYIFHNRVCRRLFAMVHPRWGISMGLAWAGNSYRRHKNNPQSETFKGEDKEPLVCYSRKYMAGHPEIDFFIYGHRHIELDLMLSDKVRMLILGDWISQFTFAVFDGEHLYMEDYVEGESQV